VTQKKDCTDKIVQNDQDCAIKIVFYRTRTRHAFATAFSIGAFIELGKVARLTGLEPATSGVTGRHSNQLSYNRATRLRSRSAVARLTGLEPATSGVTGRHSNQLSYNRQLIAQS
jgi:hypothetical protein